jgi:hypothetical protein
MDKIWAYHFLSERQNLKRILKRMESGPWGSLVTSQSGFNLNQGLAGVLYGDPKNSGALTSQEKMLVQLKPGLVNDAMSCNCMSLCCFNDIMVCNCSSLHHLLTLALISATTPNCTHISLLRRCRCLGHTRDR